MPETNRREEDRRKDDLRVHEALGEMRGELKGISTALSKLPCHEHTKAITANTVRSGAISAVSGSLSGMAAALMAVFVGRPDGP
jgi:hypothetical protein